MTIRKPLCRSFKSPMLLLAAALSPAAVLAPGATQAQPEASGIVTLYATGLNNPRPPTGVGEVLKIEVTD